MLYHLESIFALKHKNGIISMQYSRMIKVAPLYIKEVGKTT